MIVVVRGLSAEAVFECKLVTYVSKVKSIKNNGISAIRHFFLEWTLPFTLSSICMIAAPGVLELLQLIYWVLDLNRKSLCLGDSYEDLGLTVVDLASRNDKRQCLKLNLLLLVGPVLAVVKCYVELVNLSILYQHESWDLTIRKRVVDHVIEGLIACLR